MASGTWMLITNILVSIKQWRLVSLLLWILWRFKWWNCPCLGGWNRQMSETVGDWWSCELCYLESSVWYSYSGCLCVSLVSLIIKLCIFLYMKYWNFPFWYTHDLIVNINRC
jgi:hypothetical protein